MEILSRRTALNSLCTIFLTPKLIRSGYSSELSADVIIIGGGFGGCAAALAAARNGMNVIMTEETDWIGGQSTAQAVPPDEHRWIESFGATQSYREYRRRIREYYRRNYPLTGEARNKWNLNPGNGNVSRICHEPRVSLAVLTGMLSSFVSSGKIRIMRKHKAVSADTSGDYVRTVSVQNLESGKEIILNGKYFLDATELGDLLPLSGTEYVTGFESRSETGEPHAPAEAQPLNMQAFSVCFAMEYLEGENHTINKPEDYDYWKKYVPRMTPPWSGPLLSWRTIHPITLEERDRDLNPGTRTGWWGYRRIIDKNNFMSGTFSGDITLVNWPQLDYVEGNICEVSETEAARHLRGGKQLSLSLLYWMQTEAPRPDGGTGYPGLRLRNDIVGTEDGLAKYPYIRESRRIKAEFTVLEQHVGTEARIKLTGKSRQELSAEKFFDSVGVGSYRIDLHPSSGGDNYIDVSSLPFQIPLGSLVPQRMKNVLPACKNLGVTHITNGCYRLHPVEWNIGESAGALAAFCANRNKQPRQVRNDKKLLSEFQKHIQAQGIEINWPKIGPL